MDIKIILFFVATGLFYLILSSKRSTNQRGPRRSEYMNISGGGGFAPERDYSRRAGNAHSDSNHSFGDRFGHLFNETEAPSQNTPRTSRAPIRRGEIEIPLPHPDTFAPKDISDSHETRAHNSFSSNATRNKLAKMKAHAMEFIKIFDEDTKRQSERRTVNTTANQNPFGPAGNTISSFFGQEANETEPIQAQQAMPQAPLPMFSTENETKKMETRMQSNDAFVSQSPFDLPKPPQRSNVLRENAKALPDIPAQPNIEPKKELNIMEAFYKTMGYQNKLDEKNIPKRKDSEWKPALFRP